MTVKELTTKLLNLPMNHEIFLYYEKEFIDEHGEKCNGYYFDIDSVKMCNRNSEIVFTDWRDKDEALTTVTSTRKVGKWIDCGVSARCSNCGCKDYEYSKHHYCPNCGAKMESEDKE